MAWWCTRTVQWYRHTHRTGHGAYTHTGFPRVHTGLIGSILASLVYIGLLCPLWCTLVYFVHFVPHFGLLCPLCATFWSTLCHIFWSTLCHILVYFVPNCGLLCAKLCTFLTKFGTFLTKFGTFLPHCWWTCTPVGDVACPVSV